MNTRGHRQAGFTLMELVMVVAIIALVLGLAMPRLLPAIASSNLEGSARHLANFGRAAITRSAFGHDRFTFRCDLARGEYWLVKWKEPATELDGEEDKDGLFKKDSLFDRGSGSSSSSRKESTRKPSLFDTEHAADLFSQMPDLQALVTQGAPEDFQERGEEMQARFDRFARLSMMSRARNVKHEGILGEIGPLFEKKFTLDTGKDAEDDYEEVKETLLSRTWLPEGVQFDSVDVGSANRGKGVVEVEITPLGLAEPVTFYLRGEDGDYYTVTWDAITGGARIAAGKQVAE
ncbi:MAG: prepilin-type N-terminal cleavage/methylation domain-containing protein [FCB group bacterium]|nr:prepilin-type N-terminal cleavage/methylation domain-containing protein [FCB group bacterium]